MENKTTDYNMSESLKKEDKNITCKDGYCFIPNSEGNKNISNENINIFDPLQINFIVKELYLPYFIHNVQPNQEFNFYQK